MRKLCVIYLFIAAFVLVGCISDDASESRGWVFPLDFYEIFGEEILPEGISNEYRLTRVRDLRRIEGVVEDTLLASFDSMHYADLLISAIKDDGYMTGTLTFWSPYELTEDEEREIVFFIDALFIKGRITVINTGTVRTIS